MNRGTSSVCILSLQSLLSFFSQLIFCAIDGETLWQWKNAQWKTIILNMTSMVTFFLIIPRLFRLQFWWCVAENLTKSMDWFLYDNGLRHEKVKWLQLFFTLFLIAKYLLFLLAYKNLPILENLKTMSSVNRKYGTWFSTDNLLL